MMEPPFGGDAGEVKSGGATLVAADRLGFRSLGGAHGLSDRGFLCSLSRCRGCRMVMHHRGAAREQGGGNNHQACNEMNDVFHDNRDSRTPC